MCLVSTLLGNNQLIMLECPNSVPIYTAWRWVSIGTNSCCRESHLWMQVDLFYLFRKSYLYELYIVFKLRSFTKKQNVFVITANLIRKTFIILSFKIFEYNYCHFLTTLQKTLNHFFFTGGKRKATSKGLWSDHVALNILPRLGQESTRCAHIFSFLHIWNLSNSHVIEQLFETLWKHR